MSGFDRDRVRWFGQNILPHEPSLRRWLARRPAHDIDPDDVIQEAYTILAELESVDGIRHPRAYLFQVAHSVITRHVRRARIVSIHAVEDLGTLDIADATASPETCAIDRNELRHLAQMIDAMPAKTREAFVLRRVEGLSQREIAAHMRISENTVETHISRGIRFLIDRFGRGGTPASRVSKAADLESAPLHAPARQQSRH